MLKLTLIVPFVNQYEITTQALSFLVKHKTNPDTRILAFDNGSEFEIQKVDGVEYITSEVNIGNYPLFKEALQLTTDSLVGIVHNDLFVYEHGYDDRILRIFEEYQQLGLLGFVGSDEVDAAGGRGLGTASNFQGRHIGNWVGSPAQHHGRTLTGYMNSAIVDGCAMIFRRKALEEIGFNPNLPIHHFYDKIMSCQCLEKKWQVGTLGIECDHLNGQTANTQQAYPDAARDWFIMHGCETFEDVAAAYGVALPQSWDHATYLVSEKYFLTEFRDQKHLIPIKVQ